MSSRTTLPSRDGEHEVVVDPPERIMVPGSVEVRAVGRVDPMTVVTAVRGLVGALLVVAAVWIVPVLLERVPVPPVVGGGLLVAVWTLLGTAPGLIKRNRTPS